MIGLIRRFYLLILLVLAVMIPYAAMSDSTAPLRDKIRTFVASSPDEVDSVEGIDDPVVSRLLARQQQLTSSQPEASGQPMTPTVTLEGILRFDINPRWVLQNWPTVSTSRIDGPLDGLRVPVITGTGARDVVGSLTYYFDAGQQLQRISLDGVTGDDRPLVAIVTGVFELKDESKAGVGVYVSRWNGKPISALWVRRMPVVESRDGAQQYEFSLELNRPSNYHGLSTRLQQRIQHAHAQRNTRTAPSGSWLR